MNGWIEAWISPAIVLSIFGILGVVVDKWVIGRIRTFTTRTRWNGGDRVIAALSGAPLVFGTLIGLRLATELAPISDRLQSLIDTGLLAGAVLLVTWVLERSISGLMDVYSSRAQGILPGTTIFNTIIKLSIYLTGVLVLLHSMGISVTPVITALGIGGLAVALALKDTLSNLFSGIQVILSQQLNMGDYVRLGSGEEGYIEDITWRNTTIRGGQNHLIIVPNATLANAVITNYALPDKELSFTFPLEVPSDADLDHVESCIIDVITAMQRDISNKMPTVSPSVHYSGFGDSAITVSVTLRVREFADQAPVKHLFIKRIITKFRLENLHLAIPTREVVHKTAPLEAPGDILD